MTAEVKGLAGSSKASRRGQYLGTLVVTLGSFSLGTVLAWPAPALPQLALPGGLDRESGGLTTEEQSWVAALINFGGFTAGPLASLLMDPYGKKVGRGRWGQAHQNPIKQAVPQLKRKTFVYSQKLL